MHVEEAHSTWHKFTQNHNANTCLTTKCELHSDNPSQTSFHCLILNRNLLISSQFNPHTSTTLRTHAYLPLNRNHTLSLPTLILPLVAIFWILLLLFILLYLDHPWIQAHAKAEQDKIRAREPSMSHKPKWKRYNNFPAMEWKVKNSRGKRNQYFTSTNSLLLTWGVRHKYRLSCI
jgi:hypothetical protein